MATRIQVSMMKLLIQISSLCLISLQACVLMADEASRSNEYLSEKFVYSIQTSNDFTIALLPVENFSVNPEIATSFRQILEKHLIAKGYTVLEQKQIDQALGELGLTHAGQLNLLSFDELSEAIPADAFLSGAVEQAVEQHIGIYNAYVYTCSLKLQNRTGETLWYALQERIAKRRFAIDPVNALLDIFLIKRGSDIQEAAASLAHKLLESLPDGPVQISDDLLLEQAITIEAVSTEIEHQNEDLLEQATEVAIEEKEIEE